MSIIYNLLYISIVILLLIGFILFSMNNNNVYIVSFNLVYLRVFLVRYNVSYRLETLPIIIFIFRRNNKHITKILCR